MSVKPIREYACKKIMQSLYPEDLGLKICLVSPETLAKPDAWTTLSDENPWLLTEKLVAKPDQLVKRRGKHGLMYVDKTYEEVRGLIEERMQKEITLDNVAGVLDNFIIEPITPHKDEEEIYVCIQSHRYFDEVFFYHQGGADDGDVDAKALRLQIPVETDIDKAKVISDLMKEIPEARKDKIATFVTNLYTSVFLKAHFTYLEINPVVITDTQIVPLDCAAKLDEKAAFLVEPLWQGVDFPAPFGRAPFPEEKFVSDMDAKIDDCISVVSEASTRISKSKKSQRREAQRLYHSKRQGEGDTIVRQANDTQSILEQVDGGVCGKSAAGNTAEVKVPSEESKLANEMKSMKLMVLKQQSSLNELTMRVHVLETQNHSLQLQLLAANGKIAALARISGVGSDSEEDIIENDRELQDGIPDDPEVAPVSDEIKALPWQERMRRLGMLE